ncbi:MAG: bifunctional folylpolyglutamate synthase/dihydrofolate synthase [Elusimicrobia bacterium]|nr:bifunctional folylpolyglutamate synthase/dihydrofolate synthase [Elusimicrobiota bacterium]
MNLNYTQALKYVENLGEFVYDFNLTRIKRILKKLDNPQDKLKVIHVAGTNGKGSVCAYISAILQKAGYRVGLYTSPHILDIRERIQINREKISKSDFAKFVFNYSLLPTPYSLTYFEFITAMAFWHFERNQVDFAIMEVGLGGRLDATNAVENPLISVITNISLEHTQYLGNTIKKITKEKSGIIKNNGVVATAESGDALKVIKDICRTKKAKLIHSGQMKYGGYKTPLLGEHQKQNMHLAVTVCRFLNIQKKYIVAGLKNTYWPGRFEITRLTANGSLLTVVLDVAHNPAGMTALYNSIKNYLGRKINPVRKGVPQNRISNRVNFVFAVFKDKDYKKMIKIISPAVKNVFISAVKNKRALHPGIIKNEFRNYIPEQNIFICTNIKRAIKSAITASEDFCITGSIYTIGEGIKWLKI